MGVEVQIPNIVAIPLGLIVASGAAAAILALLASDWKFFPPAFAIVLIVAVGAGLPIYLTARAARKDTPRIAAALGFAVGAVIPAILVFWSIPDQASVGGTVTVLDGRYTLAGWLQNLALLGGFGMLGVGGALLFWLLVGRGEGVRCALERRECHLCDGPSCWRRRRSDSSQQPSSSPTSARIEAAITPCATDDHRSARALVSI